AYEMVMKCSHTFNLLDARGAISVTERAAYIGRVRALARAVAQAYHDSRERLGFPMLTPGATPRRLAVLVDDVLTRAPDRDVELKGPSVKVGLGADGSPSQALQKWA